jgi:signal transduction histidine kinase
VAVLLMLLLLSRWLWGVTGSFVEEHLDRLIVSEANVVRATIRGGERKRLIDEINREYAKRPVTSRVILVADERYRWLAGNLEVWPDSVGDRTGWHTLHPMREVGPSEARILHDVLPDGSHLLVGYDLNDYNAGKNAFLALLVGISVPMVVAMLLLGWFVRRTLLSHVAAINTTATAIVQGDLKGRLPEQRSDSELNLLVRTINRMLDQLEELVAGIANVSNSIAHDLRTPLAEARSRFDDLLQRLPASDRSREELEAGIGDIDRLIGTFEGLLRLAQIESGARRSGFVSMDVATVVHSMVEVYRPAAEDKRLDFAVAPLPPALMHGDPSLIAQALGNLIDNAIKYTHSGGRIELSMATRERGCGVQIFVCDNGPGIDVAERSRVTARFYRGKAVRTVSGTGLGLSLVSAIATLHGGGLLLQDNHPGLRATLMLGTSDVAATSEGLA